MDLSKGFTALHSSIDATVEIPADQLPATYAALSGWATSPEYVALGDSGQTTQVVQWTNLSGLTSKRLSFTESGTYQLNLTWNVTDPLQILLKAASISKEVITFRETLDGDSTVSYFQGYVSSAVKQPGDGSQAIQLATTIEITTPIVEVLA